MIINNIKTILGALRRMWGALTVHVGRMWGACVRAGLVRLADRVRRFDNYKRYYNEEKEKREKDR